MLDKGPAGSYIIAILSCLALAKALTFQPAVLVNLAVVLALPLFSDRWLNPARAVFWAGPGCRREQRAAPQPYLLSNYFPLRIP